MTGPEHYREAEKLLAHADVAIDEGYSDRAGLMHAEAQVHATLALAAATALNDGNGGLPAADFATWKDAAATKASVS